jgi:hypothetical protein
MYIQTTTYCSDIQAFIVVLVTQMYLQLVEDNMMLWEVVVQDTHIQRSAFVQPSIATANLRATPQLLVSKMFFIPLLHAVA